VQLIQVWVVREIAEFSAIIRRYLRFGARCRAQPRSGRRRSRASLHCSVGIPACPLPSLATYRVTVASLKSAMEKPSIGRMHAAKGEPRSNGRNAVSKLGGTTKPTSFATKANAAEKAAKEGRELRAAKMAMPNSSKRPPVFAHWLSLKQRLIIAEKLRGIGSSLAEWICPETHGREWRVMQQRSMMLDLMMSRRRPASMNRCG
jgi:hypothetical protein